MFEILLHLPVDQNDSFFSINNIVCQAEAQYAAASQVLVLRPPSTYSVLYIGFPPS